MPESEGQGRTVLLCAQARERSRYWCPAIPISVTNATPSLESELHGNMGEGRVILYSLLYPSTWKSTWHIVHTQQIILAEDLNESSLRAILLDQWTFSKKFCTSPADSTAKSYLNPLLLSISTATTEVQSTTISHYLASRGGALSQSYSWHTMDERYDKDKQEPWLFKPVSCLLLLLPELSMQTPGSHSLPLPSHSHVADRGILFVFLRYNSCSIKFTVLKCTTPWFLVHS